MFTPDPNLPIVSKAVTPRKMQPAQNAANFAYAAQENSAPAAKASCYIYFGNDFPDGAEFTISSSSGAATVVRVSSAWKPGLLPSDVLTGNPEDTCTQLAYMLNDHPDLGSEFDFQSTGVELYAYAKEEGDLSLSVAVKPMAGFSATLFPLTTGADATYGTADPNFTTYVEVYADLSRKANPTYSGLGTNVVKVDELEKRYLNDGENKTWFDVAAILRNYVATKNPAEDYGLYLDEEAMLGFFLRYGCKRTFNYGTANQYTGRKSEGYDGEYFLINGGFPATTPAEYLDLEAYWKRDWMTTGNYKSTSRIVFSVRWSELDPTGALGLQFSSGTASFDISANGSFTLEDNPDDTFINILNMLLINGGTDYTVFYQNVSWDLAVFTVEANDPTNGAMNITTPAKDDDPAIRVLDQQVSGYEVAGQKTPTALTKNLNLISDFHSTHYNERHVYSFIYVEEQELRDNHAGTSGLALHYQYVTEDGLTSAILTKDLGKMVGDPGMNGVMHVVYSAEWLGIPSGARTFTVWGGIYDQTDFVPHLLFEPVSHFLTYKQERTGRTIYWLNELGGWNDIGLVSWEVESERKSTQGEKPRSRQPKYTDTVRYVKELETVETITAATRWVSQGKGNFSLEGDTGQAGYYGGLAKSSRVVLWNNDKQLFESLLVKNVKWVKNQDEPVSRMQLVLERSYFENNAI